MEQVAHGTRSGRPLNVGANNYIRRGAELLSGTLGSRILNMIMTLAMFARLSAVSTAVRIIAYDAGAWKGLTVYLHRCWQPSRHLIFDRLLQTWRLLNVLYLNYAEANYLEDRRHCPVVGVWHLRRRSLRSQSNRNTYPHIFSSYDVVRSGVRIDFNVRCRGRMPAFEVGWTTTWDFDYLLDDIMSGTPMHSYVRFRVVNADSLLAPQADRGRWYNYDAMGDDAAIRLPRHWADESSDTRRCLRIGLMFTDRYMSVYMNGHRRSAQIEPQFSHGWAQQMVQYVILLISNESAVRDLTLETVPALLS